MSWPSSVIVDAVFIAVYIILTGLALFNVIKHGHGKQAGFLHLLIFSVVRLIANILLVYSYNTHYKHSGALTWGFLLQGLGFSFLISSSLAFYARAICNPGETLMMAGFRDRSNGNGGRSGLITGILSGSPKATIHKILHLINFIALILLITGYNDSNLFSNNTNLQTAKVKLNASVRVGDLMYCGLTAAILVLTIYRFMQRQIQEHQIILTAMLIALPIMAVRAVYVAIRTFSDDFLHPNLALKVILEYVMEVITLLVYSAMGFIVKRYQQNQQNQQNQQYAPEMSDPKYPNPAVIA